MRVLTTLILVLSCLSCSFENNEKSTKLIDFNSIEFTDILESEFLNNSNIISLETNDECLFGEDYNIFIADGEFFVMDMRGSFAVLRFDSLGNYVNKCGRKGKGPGELVAFSDAIVSNNKLEILSGNFGNISTYDLNGTFIESKSYLKGSAVSFIKDTLNGVYYFYNSRGGLSKYAITAVDYETQKITGEFFPYKGFFPLNELVFSHGGKGLDFIFRESIQPIVFALNRNKIDEYLVFKFDTPSMDVNDISFDEYSRNIILNGEFRIAKFLENSDNFYFCIVETFPNDGGNKVFHIVMSKRTGLFQQIKFRENKIWRIKPAFSMSNDYLYFSIDPITVSKDDIWLDKLNRITDISINSNPFIAKWQIKQ